MAAGDEGKAALKLQRNRQDWLREGYEDLGPVPYTQAAQAPPSLPAPKSGWRYDPKSKRIVRDGAQA